MGSRLTLIGVVLFGAGILMLALMLRRIYKRIRFRDTGDKLKRPPKSPSYTLIFFSLVIIAIAQCFLWLGSQLQYYRTLESAGYLGQVLVEREHDAVKSLKVSYTPATGDSSDVPNQFYLSGDSWRLSGTIINFKFANKYWGLPTRAYKTVLFDSRYLERAPRDVANALLHENVLEGGPGAVFGLFRDSRYFKWFATVDSFAIDYVTTPARDLYALKLAPDKTVDLQKIEQAGTE